MNERPELLRVLQTEADQYGFHKELNAWVCDGSSVARVLMARLSPEVK